MPRRRPLCCEVNAIYRCAECGWCICDRHGISPAQEAIFAAHKKYSPKCEVREILVMK